jgi:2-oxoacid:acceptor oxidoreductase delta subunit (pyruvate/2-ketoisovalerate family)
MSVRYRSWRPHTENKTGAQRYERPVYDYDSKTSPCRDACPTAHDIPLALLLMARRRPDLAYRVFREESPFPAITGRVCYRPCEFRCNRAEYDEAVSIAALERFAAEHAGDEEFPTAVTRHAARVAVVGSGPAGLSCAYHLRRLGYPVAVYEASADPGGALRYGIPAYRLPRAVLDREIRRLEALGISFQCGVRIGAHVSFARLREEHAAVFVGAGLGRPRRLAVPGDDRARVVSGLDWLRQANEGASVPLGRRVVVIGGGDVAVDVARVALRLGAAGVVMCAAEREPELPAHPHEVQAARHEGVRVLGGRAPLEILASNGALRVLVGRVRGLQRDRYGAATLDVDDADTQDLDADSVVYAIGQELAGEGLPEALADRARIAVGEWGETRMPGVFAGGDAAGTYTVAQALGSGKRAAIGIDVHLQRRHFPHLARRIGLGAGSALSFTSYLALIEGRPEPARAHVVAYPEVNLDYFRPAARIIAPEADVTARRTSFIEVAAPFDATAAVGEARRCFTCGFCSMCGNCFTFCPDSAVAQRDGWGFEIDLDHCKGCGVCVQECPRAAMSMIPEEES